MQNNFVVLSVVLIVNVSFGLSIRTQNTLVGTSSNFNVVRYGAVGDGLQDDTQAITKAWSDACGASQDGATLIVPRGKTFLVTPTTFSGPCKSNNINIQIMGTIVAPSNGKNWKNCNDNCWLVFTNIHNLSLYGSGAIDGKGSFWWNTYRRNNDDSSCNSPCALKFINCNGLKLKGLTHVNSPAAHISIVGCDNSIISNIHIKAPDVSPNTDGIDLSSSSQVQILDSSIATGDDCISIGSGTYGINVSGITCGPGHGISIGSLGRGGAQAKVEQVFVKHCSFIGTTNGARIKTWQGGQGYAKDITFEDIPLKNVRNPIIIDQFYCSGVHDCGIQKSAVAISGVTYRGFQGTSASQVAITLNCSSTVSCTGISMENINITSSSGTKASARCNNAKGSQSSVTPRVPCLN
ncbi:hypothetical protein RND81_10G152200 [Saponaria officinalis]|uniref:endo-polygalacturonase n=1 Tax=Saponaria officinalis TaxID=3572 RepID=A0AAW1I2N9_SAPOF